MVILITLVAPFLSWQSSLTLKRHFYVTAFCLKRLSEDSNQAMADPTADVRQLADHEADKRYQNVTLTSAIVADCRRKQGGRNQGSSKLTVWQWLLSLGDQG